MNEESRRVNLRRHPRISWNFIVKFRLKDSADVAWETTTIKNISEGGCFFYSGRPYEPGQVLELAVQFPSLKELTHFAGEVKRCEYHGSKLSTLYGIGICFVEMDKEKKKEFVDTIDFFLKKQCK